MIRSTLIRTIVCVFIGLFSNQSQAAFPDDFSDVIWIDPDISTWSQTAEITADAVYITNVVPWRPPQNRDPTPDEIAMLLPFLERHVALVKPDVIILMGNISCQAALGKRGITRLRGDWVEAFDVPAMPMVHPAYLLRTPSAKREAWADLLAIKAGLGGNS